MSPSKIYIPKGSKLEQNIHYGYKPQTFRCRAIDIANIDILIILIPIASPQISDNTDITNIDI